MGLNLKRNSSPFMGKYPAEPGDGADLEIPPNSWAGGREQLFPTCGEVPAEGRGWGFLRLRSMEADP